MNPVGNTFDKSCGNDLHQPENRQGLLAGLGPASPGPPRAAAVAHQMLQRSESRFFTLHPATPGGHGAADRQEDPLHDLSREHMAQTLNTGVHARFSYMPPPPSCLLDRQATVSPMGLAREHPPGGESPGPAWTTGQIGAPPFGGAHEAPSGDENANLLDLVVNRLLSDEYEAYDPEDLNIRALMADFEATFPDTGAHPPPTGPDHGHPPMGGCPGPDRTTGPTGAPPSDGAHEAPSGDENANLLDLVVNRLLSDEYEAYDPEDPNVRALMADYEATILATGLDTGAAPPGGPVREHPPVGESSGSAPDFGQKRTRGDCTVLTGKQRQAILHIFETDPQRSSKSIADEVGVGYTTIRQLRKKFIKTGNLKPGDRAKRLSAEQRRAILHIFETDPQRSNYSIVDEIGVGYTTIQVLKRRFNKTGDIKVGDCAKRLSAEQRRAILHIFETDPERNNYSIADEMGVAYTTIQGLRKRFSKTGNIKLGDHSKHLSAEQRRAILHIFETDPERSNQSIADEMGVSPITILVSRRQFSKTGNLKAKDNSNRLNADQRRALSHIFETDPQRSNLDIADEIGASLSTIKRLRRQFSKTGNLKAKDSSHRLTAGQRRAISHIFETDPQRSNQSIADEFGFDQNSIRIVRKRFDKTGNIKAGDHANRLNAEQRRAILHIFKTDPERDYLSIMDEFGISSFTVAFLRKRFDKTGNIKAGNHANRLSADQRQAMLHIFETDPKRSHKAIADEFGVACSTIIRLRKQFDKTGNIKAGDSSNRLSAEQRRAIMHIFETDPKRSYQSIADEFNVVYSTIKRFRKRLNETGNPDAA